MFNAYRVICSTSADWHDATAYVSDEYLSSLDLVCGTIFHWQFSVLHLAAGDVKYYMYESQVEVDDKWLRNTLHPNKWETVRAEEQPYDDDCLLRYIGQGPKTYYYHVLEIEIK